MNAEAQKKEEGFVLVIVAIFLVALIGFVALAVDVGVLYGAKTSAQEVADAAALAGAFTFINNPTAPQPSTASDNALQFALNNSIMGQAVTAADVTVNVDVALRRVTVDVASTQNTYFARVLGTNTAAISVEGIAEAAQYSTGSACVKPWFVPNTIFATTGPCAACTAGEVLIDPTTREVTAFGKTKIGQKFTLKPQSPSSAIGPGQFYAIQLPDSGGGHDYETNISTCSNAYVRCGEYYSVETGNMVGPTKHGVEDLIGNNPDVFVEVGKYQRSNGTYSDTSINLVVAPVWNACNLAGFCPSENFPNGTQVNLEIVGFAVFFLKGIESGDVTAYLINISSCGPSGGGGGGSNETGGTVLSLPLRLIRTQ
jgi:Flp pilus assembly protein TadG